MFSIFMLELGISTSVFAVFSKWYTYIIWVRSMEEYIT